MGVSRTAVWKHMGTLREEGYQIDAVPRSGYRLVGVPDKLYGKEVTHDLGTQFLGKTVYYYESIDSTNREARVLASGGAPHGSLVLAEEQTGGKGRLGRGWFSPQNMGIWCTLILRPEIAPAEAPPITMLAAVAVAAAVEKVIGIKPGIKWPNDLLMDGKKFCGILTEMNAEMDKVHYLLVGIGINVKTPPDHFPKELKSLATSLCQWTKQTISRLALIRQMLVEFEKFYSVWLQSGFEPVLEEWKKRCVTLDCPVRISTPKESWEGWAEDVKTDGSLVLRFPDGTRQSFMTGEVSLRTKD